MLPQDDNRANRSRVRQPDGSFELPDEHDTPRARSWNLWIPLGLLAFGVYEFTAQAPLSLTILCLKFGANDLATGWWLWRRDPWKPRGRAIFWFYTAYALSKVCATALAGALLCVILLQHRNRRGNAPPDLFIEGGIVMLAALLSGILCVVVGVIFAWVAQVRVWVSSVSAADRRADVFPPAVNGANRARVLIGVALMVVSIAVFLVCLGAALEIAGRVGAPGTPLELFLEILLAVVALLSLMAGSFAVAEKIAARNAWECWGSEKFGYRQ